MAIYYLRAKMITRSAGHSATAVAAYRAAERIEDQRTGLTFDYRSRGGVDHVEALAPAYAPAWVQDRPALWNTVEQAETRKNSQVAREIRVALPHELDHAQRVELVRDFCQCEFVDRGMVANIALRKTVRAVSLDRETLPQLSAGAWQLKERGTKVAAVQVWRELKTQAAEVACVAQKLAGTTRDWLQRVTEQAAEQARSAVDRVAPNAWDEFFAAAAPGAEASSEALAQDIEAECQQEAQREAIEREARERLQERGETSA